MTALAILNRNATFTLTVTAGRIAHSSTFPLSRFASWLAFYRHLAKRRPKFYAADVSALEAIEPEVRAMLARAAG